MMNRKKALLSILVGLVAIILLNSCGPSQADIDATTTKIAAAISATQIAEAPTSIPPTAPPTPTLERLPGSIPEGIVVTFTDNEGCTNSSIPTELLTGEYTFILRDLSEVNHTVYLSYLIEGKTFQDLLDIQTRPGRYYPRPDWVVYPETVDAWRNESRNELYFTYSLEEGEHFVYLGSNNPASLWFCAPILVR